MTLPLWIASLFQYDIDGKIADEVKSFLYSTMEKDNDKVTSYLLNIWRDVTRKEDDEINILIKKYMDEIERHKA